MPQSAHASPHLTLCACSAVASLAAGGQKNATQTPPSRLVIGPLGSFDARERGAVIFQPTAWAGMAARQAAAKLGMRLALDFSHNTLPGTAAYAAEQEPRRVAAWGMLGFDPAAGYVLDGLEWTPSGLSAWEDKAFQDISPAVFRDADGVVLAFHSVALCRHGELDGLTLDAAISGAAAAAALSAFLPLSTPNDTPDPARSMKPTPALIALLSALSVTLSPEADEAATEAALLDAAKKIDGMKPAAKTAEIEVEGMSVTALSARIAAIEGAEESRRRDAIVAAATLAGKVIPLSAEALKKTPLEVLQELADKAPAGVVPLSADGQPVKPQAAKPEAFSAESVAMFARFGLTPDEVAEAEKVRQ